MASVLAEYPTTLLHLIDSPSPSSARPRRKRRFDLEFKTPALKRSPPTSAALLQWIAALSPLHRLQLFAVENPWLSSVLRQMFAKKMKEGEGRFTVINNPHKTDTDLLDDYFTFTRAEGEASLLNYERELEQQLRFCDTCQYLDTVALSVEFIGEFERCLHVAAQISHGAAFQTPCLVLWDPTVKSWVWQCPPWVLSSAVSLSALALAAFEKNCWARFFEATGRDPKAPGENQGFTWDTFPPDACLGQIDVLRSFWKTLGESQKAAIVGDPQSIMCLFQASKRTYQDLQNKRSSDSAYSALLQPSSYSSNWKLTCPSREPYYSACRTRLQHYLNQRSAELIFKKMDEDMPGEYIEFLLMSPLERTWSIFDISTRKIAEKIKEAMTAQIADDLVKSEEKSPIKPTKTKGKKKKKTKRREVSPIALVVTEQKDEETPGEVAAGVVEDILTEALRQISTRIYVLPEDAGFQTVQSGRKKTEKPPKPTEAPNTPSFPVVKRPTSRPKAVPTTTPVPSHSPVVIHWAEPPSTEIPTVKFEAEMDFPPLPASQTSVSYESLSGEMMRFRGEIVGVMVSRKKTMVSFLQKMQEVVAFLFPGAYVKIFGSYATRLALPISDLDLVVVNSGCPRDEISSAVKNLSEVLPIYKWAVHAQSITTASVPVVKLTVDPHYFGGELNDYIKVDITFDDTSDCFEVRHIGLASVAWVKQLLGEFPFAQDCILALKNVLYLQTLNSAYLGGLSSYSLVLWVAAYLRAYQPKCGGEALLGVLKHYSDFDAKTTGVACSTEGKQYYRRLQPAFSVCETMDPVTPGNNTTKGAYRLPDIQSVFRISYDHLSASLSKGAKDSLSRLFFSLSPSLA